MFIFDTDKASLASAFETTSTAVRVMRARQRKRLYRGLPLLRFCGAHPRSFLTLESCKTGFNKLHGRPYRTLKSASDRLKIHRHQRRSTIFSKRKSFSLGYLRVSPSPEHFVSGLCATQSNVTTKTIFDPILTKGELSRDFFLEHVHPFTSHSVAEYFLADFFDNLVKGVSSSLSPNIQDVLKPLREDTNGVGSINNGFLLDSKHEGKFLYEKSASAEVRLVDNLMENFWKRSDGGSTSLAAQSTSSNSIISESGKPKYSSTITASKGNKRSRIIQGRDDGGDDENDEERSSKRPKTFLLNSEIIDRKFACPYRKHNPQKYSVQKWRSCALTPLETVARLKGHLYRHHRIFQCQRCKVLFPSQNDVQTHLMAAQACEITTAEPVDGITSDIVDRLRSRKKTYPGQTEEDRWREVYKMIFPHEIIPSPYFEPVQENEGSKPGAIEEELGAYEEYIRRELPRAFRTALEEVAILEAQPIAESIRLQLMNIISDVQNRVLASYRARTGPLNEHLTATSSSQPIYHNSEANEQNISAISILTPPESLFQPPPPPPGGNSRDLENSDSTYNSAKSREPRRKGGEE